MAIITGTSGNDSLTGTTSADSISGLAGNDTLNGLGGIDTLNGGSGDDRYIVTAGDVLVDSGGVDTVVSDLSWTLGAGFENLTMAGTSAINVTGNELDNSVIGNSAANYFNLRAGNDFIQADGGNDRIDMSGFGAASYGDDTIDGGSGFDTISFTVGSGQRSAVVVDLAAGTARGGGEGGSGSVLLTSIEGVIGSEFGDRLTGSNVSERLEGRLGDDTLLGMGGNDTLVGGAGQDKIVFASAPGSGNVDQITDFVSATDKLVFDNEVFGALGGEGDFAAADARFVAGAGLISGQDASDRIVYNTTTGALYYDADGSGAAAAIQVTSLQGAPQLAAEDLSVANAPGLNRIQGTAGNDTLTGTDGNDSIDGLGGNDSLIGHRGFDRLIGGDGNDTLNGFAPRDDEGLFGSRELVADTMSGGLGDDVYLVDNPNDVLSDAGGIDTVVAADMDWTLAAGFENLTIMNDVAEIGFIGIGNDRDNFIDVTWTGSRLEGRGGNDTIEGSTASSSGSDMLGQEGNDSLIGHGGSDSLHGGSGDDTLVGGEDADDLSGGSGADELSGGSEADSFIFDVRPGAPDTPRDLITDFAAGMDRIRLDARVMPELGVSGTLAAGDPRFHAAAGAVAGHDADDRLVYNTTTGDLYFDPDGNGAGAAHAIVTVRAGTAAAPLAATDITVDNGTAPPGGTAGNDTLVGGSNRGGDGDDLLIGSDNVDQLDGENGNDTLRGEAGDDELNGGAGNDSMVGGAGDDAFDLFNEGDAAGVDTMDGGAGHDRFLVTPGDVVMDTGGGIDTVFAQSNWTLGPNLENLTFHNFFTADNGIGRLAGTGNELDNVLTGISADGVTLDGRAGNDSLVGSLLADTLIGGTGIDTMDGSFGDDAYVVDAPGDIVIERAGAGVDAVQSSVTRLMEANVENLTLTGSSAINGTGNALANLMIGNGAANSLSGADGRDTLRGGAGNDTLLGGAGNDRLEGRTGNDSLMGGSGNDLFMFLDAPGASGVDRVADFVRGSDEVVLENAVHRNLGTSGAMAAGDARFRAGAGITTGQDSSDRIVYNTSSGQLFYDADGSGAGSSVLIATFAGNPALTATDFTVL